MSRSITDNGLRMIRSFEGFYPTIYLDIAGKPTIGYGHLILPGEDFSAGVTKEEAELLLLRELELSSRAIGRLIYVPLSDAQFDSLSSFCFNLGGGALQRSTLRSMLNRLEYYDAADQFPRWCYAGAIKSKGLLRRRLMEREVFLWGTYESY